MMLALCSILLIILFIMPFISGSREFKKKEDAEPLYIDMNHLQNPRYFAVSFRKILSDSMNESKFSKGVNNFELSKPETIEILDQVVIKANAVYGNILYCKDSLRSGEKAILEKEVYVQRIADIGENNLLRALVCDGDIHIAKGTRFTRWLDAEGNIGAGEMCDLGLSASCGGKLSLARNCSFKRLYGFPVTTGDPLESPGDPGVKEAAATFSDNLEPDNNKAVICEGESIERNISRIRLYGRKDCSIITIHSLSIEDYAVIRGDIKTHSNLVTGKGVTITGNVFAEGDIHLGPYNSVSGTVFSQGRVILEKGVIIGSRNRIKSVIGRKGIVLHDGVKVYGYVMTEETGIVE